MNSRKFGYGMEALEGRFLCAADSHLRDYVVWGLRQNVPIPTVVYIAYRDNEDTATLTLEDPRSRSIPLWEQQADLGSIRIKTESGDPVNGDVFFFSIQVTRRDPTAYTPPAADMIPNMHVENLRTGEIRNTTAMQDPLVENPVGFGIFGSMNWTDLRSGDELRITGQMSSWFQVGDTVQVTFCTSAFTETCSFNGLLPRETPGYNPQVSIGIPHPIPNPFNPQLFVPVWTERGGDITGPVLEVTEPVPAASAVVVQAQRPTINASRRHLAAERTDLAITDFLAPHSEQMGVLRARRSR